MTQETTGEQVTLTFGFFFLFHVDVREVDRDTLEPILFLLQSSDIEVQRAASAALGNLAVNGPFSLSSLVVVDALMMVADKAQRITRC